MAQTDIINTQNNQEKNEISTGFSFLGGAYTCQLDDKNRIRIPFQLKKFLGDSPVITVDIDHLKIMSGEKMEGYLEKLSKIPLDDIDGQIWRNYICTNSKPLKEDKQGRITLSDDQLDIAKISKAVVFVGDIECIKLYNEAAWEKIKQSFSTLDKNKRLMLNAKYGI